MDLLAEPKLKRPFRRRVFLIPGGEAVPPAFYRELYLRQGAAQADLAEMALALRPGRGSASWRVSGAMEAGFCETEVELLPWADLVPGAAGQAILPGLTGRIGTLWIYLATGALLRLFKLRPVAVLALLVPPAVLSGLAALALAAGLLLAQALAALIWPPAGWLAGLVLAGVLLLRVRFPPLPLADLGLLARQRGALPPALAERMGRFRAALSEALRSECDELLVVGHSTGAVLAVSLMADLLRGGLPARRPALALLTLGQRVPLLSFLPEARRFRRDLNALAAAAELTWIDVSAPEDPLCFALCDPVSVSGVAPEGQLWPLVISTALSETLSPARRRRLRGRPGLRHLQYLCAYDRPGDYDVFRVTAGPKPLAERFRGRAPSRGRIDRASSGHVTMGASRAEAQRPVR
ncbi:hypothetical protein EYE35_11015 [Cereibacter sphaeroides]|nr:hypothetical protein EYE35_11015 [Cereibacter sphaeroides]